MAKELEATMSKPRLWLPPVVVASVGGAVVLAVGVWLKSYGYAMVFIAPLVLGFALGYVAKIGHGFLTVLVGLVLLSLLGGAIWAGLGGLLCGVIFSLVAFVPTLVGAFVGNRMRRRLRREELGSADYSYLVLLFLLTGGAMALEGWLTPAFEPEVVTTRRLLSMGPARAWNRLAFYEEVPFEPPMLARVVLPVPLRTEGRLTGNGDVRRCVYSSGYLRKRITRYEPARELAFDVIEQSGIEDRSVELLSGSFRFERASDGRSELVLTTTYRPLLQARWVWRPFERAVAHSLHRHVLDGIESRVEPSGVLTAKATTR